MTDETKAADPQAVIELALCPSGHVGAFADYSEEGHRVQCGDFSCGWETSGHTTKIEAITAWNARTDSAIDLSADETTQTRWWEGVKDELSDDDRALLLAYEASRAPAIDTRALSDLAESWVRVAGSLTESDPQGAASLIAQLLARAHELRAVIATLTSLTAAESRLIEAAKASFNTWCDWFGEPDSEEKREAERIVQEALGKAAYEVGLLSQPTRTQRLASEGEGASE